VALAVDEEGRRPGHAAEVGGFDVLCDACLVGVALGLVAEAVDIEPEVITTARLACRRSPRSSTAVSGKLADVSRIPVSTCMTSGSQPRCREFSNHVDRAQVTTAAEAGLDVCQLEEHRIR
jgi:hypothetical protein